MRCVALMADNRWSAGTAGEEYVLSKELMHAIVRLRAAAEGAGPPKESGHKALPKEVNALLPGFACALTRENQRNKLAHKVH